MPTHSTVGGTVTKWVAHTGPGELVVFLEVSAGEARRASRALPFILLDTLRQSVWVFRECVMNNLIGKRHLG